MPDGNKRNAGVKPVRVGLLGCGAIGSAVLKLLCRPRFQDRFSVPYVVVRDPAPGPDPQRQHRLTQRDRIVALARETWSTRIVNAVDFEADVDARYDEVDVVVEAVGSWDGPAPVSGRTSPSPGSPCGYERTCSLLQAALAKRKPVVTANKSVIARWGNELAALAAGSAGQEPVSLKFEAAVCGSIPIVRTLASHWRDQGIRKITGILNGTCNFVLSSMSGFDEARHAADGYASKRNRALAWAFDQALAKGLAERPACGQDVSADLTNADLSGRDAAEKLVVLAAIAFGVRVDCEHVSTTPINDVAVSDIRFAAEMGYAIKQLAVAELDDKHLSLSLSVHPTLVPTHHPLANVSGQDNAVCVRGEFGNQMYTGEGAGAATATALLSDLLDIETGTARNHEFSRNGDPAGIRVRPAEQHRAMGYLRTECQDVTGAFYKKAQVLYNRGISVEQMLNLPMHTRRENGIELVPDIILIAPTDQARIDRAVDDLQSATIGADRVAICRSRPVFLRIDQSIETGSPGSHRSIISPQETEKK